MTISFSRLGKTGRLGNQLFQIASVMGMAEKYKGEAAFPEAWSYDNYFINPIPVGALQTQNQVKERWFNHYDWKLSTDSDLLGYLQSEKYFPKNIKEQFTFKEEFLEPLREKDFFKKETISISVRRGDYVGNELYYNIPPHWYLDVLLTHFPHWRECNLLIFSDDVDYCKVHFECLPNAIFPQGNEIEDLAMMTLCDNHIIANSTLSWWGAWLAESKKIVHCGRLMTGWLAEQSDIKDFYPDRWTFHQVRKIDLTDCTFTIPVFYDHQDRKKNLDLSVCMIQQAYDTNIIVGEQGGRKFQYMKEYCHYHPFEMEHFHRTKMLNDMAMMAVTPYIANWDCDIFLPPIQIWQTLDLLRKGAQMVFPYDGRFARMERNEWWNTLEKLLDIGIVGGAKLKGKHGKPVPETSVGGAVFFNKEAFIDGGMENEYMISFGPEDAERNDRFNALHFRVQRAGGCLYHMNHFCGPDSSTSNPFFRANHMEIDKIRQLILESPDKLRAYVDTWPWRHQYTESYYTRISEGAIKSAGEVMSVLRDAGVKYKSVIDIGCGVGEWNDGNPDYVGVDYNVPRRCLLIPEERYIDCNLEKEVITGKYDLALCLEVAEHISERRAKAIVEMLCSLSDQVLFSAAIPNQGGTGHQNEQWQTYWAERFAEYGYFPSDINFKDLLHDNNSVELWYRQNIVLYVKGGKGKVVDFVHPKYYEQILQHYQNLIA